MYNSSVSHDCGIAFSTASGTTCGMMPLLNPSATLPALTEFNPCTMTLLSSDRSPPSSCPANSASASFRSCGMNENCAPVPALVTANGMLKCVASMTVIVHVPLIDGTEDASLKIRIDAPVACLCGVAPVEMTVAAATVLPAIAMSSGLLFASNMPMRGHASFCAGVAGKPVH